MDASWLLDYTPKDIAQQLTIIFFEHFKRIPVRPIPLPSTPSSLCLLTMLTPNIFLGNGSTLGWMGERCGGCPAYCGYDRSLQFLVIGTLPMDFIGMYICIFHFCLSDHQILNVIVK